MDYVKVIEEGDGTAPSYNLALNRRECGGGGGIFPRSFNLYILKSLTHIMNFLLQLKHFHLRRILFVYLLTNCKRVEFQAFGLKINIVFLKMCMDMIYYGRSYMIMY